MAHHTCGAPLLYTNGAPCVGAPLVSKYYGAPLVTIFFLFFKTSNGAPGDSAPLLV